MHIMTDLLHFLTSRLLEGGPSQLLNNFRVRTPYVGPASIRTTTLDYLMIFYRLVCLRFTIKKNININIVMSGSRVNERPEAIADRKTLNITKVLFKTKPSDKKSDPPSSKISLLTPSDSPD
jgi:hypothetical protein